MPRDRDRSAACSHNKDFRAAILPMIRREKAVESESGRNWIFRVAENLTVPFRNAAGLSHQQRMPIDLIEQIPAGREKVDLVCSHQCSLRERICLDEFNCPTIGSRFGVDWKIDSQYLGVRNPKAFRPSRKNCHD